VNEAHFPFSSVPSISLTPRISAHAVHDILLKLMSAITLISILLNLTQRVKSGNFGKRVGTGYWLTRRAMTVLRIG